MAEKIYKTDISDMETETEKIPKRKAGEDLPVQEISGLKRKRKKERKDKRVRALSVALLSKLTAGDRSEDTDTSISRCESASSLQLVQGNEKSEEFLKAEDEIISFCLNPENKMPPEQAEFIIKKLAILSSAFAEKQGANIALRRQIADSMRLCKRIEKSVVTNLEQIKETCSTIPAPKPTYAEKVQVKSLSIS